MTAFNTSFPYVNQEATKADWDAATVEYTYAYVAVGASDGASVVVSSPTFATNYNDVVGPFTGTYDFADGVGGTSLSGSVAWNVEAGSWVYEEFVSGDMGVTPKIAGTTSRNVARCLEDVGSPDMFSEVVIQELGSSRYGGAAVRMSSNGSTFYWGGYVMASGEWQVRRNTAGATSLGTGLGGTVEAAPTLPPAVTVRVEVATNASGNPVVTVFADGVQKVQVEDTAVDKITTGQFGGLFGNTNDAVNISQFTVGALTLTADPLTLTLEQVGADVVLSWPAPAMTGATHVAVFRRAGTSTVPFAPAPLIELARLPVAQLTYTDPGVAPGDYAYQVFPLIAAGS